jgi:hypothetical protein
LKQKRWGKIKKTALKVKDFFKKSKKMFEPPKDLPPIAPPHNPQKGTTLQAPPFEAGNFTIRTENPLREAKKPINLPSIEPPRSQEIIIAPPTPKKEYSIPIIEDNMPSFDEAIKSIHQDIIKIETEHKKEREHHSSPKEEMGFLEPKKDDYYRPKNLGEGYFSEIKHYLKNKDANEIVEDILKKDFLTGMKDYHAHKSQGKPFFLHNQELKEKLEQKMEELMQKEEEWHELKKATEEHERRKRLLEKGIDEEAHELKELFRLIKANQILEKEAKPEEQFKLRSGQKIKTLNELRKTLSYMSEDEFSHHVNHDRNDFASWTEKALEMPDFAHKMRSATKKEDLIHLLKTTSF